MYDATTRFRLAYVLAAGLVDVDWSEAEIAVRAGACLDRRPQWLRPLASRLAAWYARSPGRDVIAAEIAAFLDERPDPPGRRAPPRPARDTTRAAGAIDRDWPIAGIASASELAERLELSPGQLAWLSDRRGLERSVGPEKLRNYRYRVIARPGGVPRVLEIPKGRLKEIQRWILREILNHVPTHPAAHGFRRGRSVVSHAAAHSGQAVVLHLDLKDFFASIRASWIDRIFRTIGYPPEVASALTGLTTNRIPIDVWYAIPSPNTLERVTIQFRLGRMLAVPHLPQGAPTSPALANLVAFRLDSRLSALAAAYGLTYSRYADDLTFSGPSRLRRQRSVTEARIAEIVKDAGLTLNLRKTSMHTQGSRQLVCGVVVNAQPNMPRGEYEQLKAILHNAARHGPQSQNRAGHPNFAAHLRGRIAWLASVNPDRGGRLMQSYEAIDWAD